MIKKYKIPRLMPKCNKDDQLHILASIDQLRSQQKIDANNFKQKIGIKNLCILLHSMRRWYKYQTGNRAREILKFHKELSSVMDLRIPVGVYRGFKLPRNDELADSIFEGEEVNIPIVRNGGCSSWTLNRNIADRFSGKTKTKIGLVVQLQGGQGLRVFIAPPSRTKKWFNNLYALSMGSSFRFNEEEYALCGKSVDVKILKIKR